MSKVTKAVPCDYSGNLLGIAGFNIPNYDYVAQSQDATHDIYTFYTGGAVGTLLATITITYTDGTKATVLNVAKT